MTQEEQLIEHLHSQIRAVVEWPLFEAFLTAILNGQKPSRPPRDYILLHALIETLEGGPPALHPLALGIIEGWPEAADVRDRVCRAWQHNRHPLLEGLIARRQWRVKAKYPELNTILRLKFEATNHFDSWMLNQSEYHSNQNTIARTLLQALDDRDETIRNNARQIILNLEPTGLNRVANAWPWLRHPAKSLTAVQLFAQAKEIPNEPVVVWVLAHLYAGHEDLVAAGPPESVPALLQALTEPDAQLSEAARRVIVQLRSPATCDELVKQIIRQDLPQAQAAVLAGGWLPTDPAERAMFYFVTRQWEAYESLDWDRRILRLYYETAALPFRQRLAALIREAGRLEYLAGLTGGQERQRSDELTTDEARLEIQILTQNEAWPALWGLVGKLPLALSVKALKILASVGWTPAHQEEARLMAQLQEYADGLGYDQESQVSDRLALSTPQAHFKLAGRINALAFDPTGPRLAIATGVKKVLIWDYHAARPVEKIELAHAAGVVAYRPDGALAIGEKTNTTTTPCQIYLWRKGRLETVGRHRGSVTALVTAEDGERLVSAGRDGQVCLWATAPVKDAPVWSREVRGWARQLVVSPDQKWLGVAAKDALLLPLPLDAPPPNAAPRVSHYSGGLAFAGNNKNVLAATAVRSLKLLRIEDMKSAQDPLYVSQPRPLEEIYKAINWQSLHSLPHLGLFAASGVVSFTYANTTDQKGQGRIFFMDRYSLQIVSQLNLNDPNLKLTSAVFSANGQTMVLGHSDRHFSLWDLRPLVLQRAFALPLSTLGPTELAVLLTTPSPAAGLQPALDYIKAILQFRYRYDIELVEPDLTIAPGEFDIEIE